MLVNPAHAVGLSKRGKTRKKKKFGLVPIDDWQALQHKVRTMQIVERKAEPLEEDVGAMQWAPAREGHQQENTINDRGTT
jgi:hypothetical protein